jgi:hypothetical protein
LASRVDREYAPLQVKHLDTILAILQDPPIVFLAGAQGFPNPMLFRHISRDVGPADQPAFAVVDRIAMQFVNFSGDALVAEFMDQ